MAQDAQQSPILDLPQKPPHLTLMAEDLERPSAPRRFTAPATPTSPSQATSLSSLPLRPRNRSPYSRNHLRTQSSNSSLSAPPLTRAHSSPVMDTFGHASLASGTRPPSPLFASARRQSPLRRPLEEGYLNSGGHFDVGETISENDELDITPRRAIDLELSTPTSPPIHHTFPRSRRRPSSPLHHILYSPALATTPPLHTSTSSPTLAAKFNESYPSNFSVSSSSMPSTPTSLRSRSPSISSLETIPDSPDAEQAAQEAYSIALLKAAVDGEVERGRDAVRRRGSLETSGRVSGGVILRSNNLGATYGGRDKRKRWSVCGAESRGDLDLETIWED